MSTLFFPRTKFEVHNFSHVCSYHLYCILCHLFCSLLYPVSTSNLSSTLSLFYPMSLILQPPLSCALCHLSSGLLFICPHFSHMPFCIYPEAFSVICPRVICPILFLYFPMAFILQPPLSSSYIISLVCSLMYPVFSSGLCLMIANLCSECLGHVNIDCWRQGRVYIAHCVPYQLAMGYYLPYQGAVGGGDDVFV